MIARDQEGVMTSVDPSQQFLHPARERLQGKVAIVTGADSGIGRASARLFAREGAKVVCVDVRDTGSPRVDSLIRADGGEAVFVRGDVSSPADCENMVATAYSSFGQLDVLFNNAGVGIRKKITEHTVEEWDFVIATNLKGVFNGVRAALPRFIEQGHGNIVNTASSHGILAVEQYPAYCASKAAIVNLTRQLAIDYGPTVRVNCVCPGPIETTRYRGYPPEPRYPEGMTDEERTGMSRSVQGLHRMGQPEEVAYCALFLASDESSYVTGHALVVDGGQTLDA
jgi:NAD(P)-dependent dehydrogenase (short-subunit alcohol dehydrogenase family)